MADSLLGVFLGEGWVSRNAVNEQTVDCCVFCLAGSLYRVAVSSRIESLCQVAVS